MIDFFDDWGIFSVPTINFLEFHVGAEVLKSHLAHKQILQELINTFLAECTSLVPDLLLVGCDGDNCWEPIAKV